MHEGQGEEEKKTSKHSFNIYHNYVTDERINISCYRENVECPPLSLKNLLAEYHDELLVEKDFREELLLQLGAINIV